MSILTRAEFRRRLFNARAEAGIPIKLTFRDVNLDTMYRLTDDYKLGFTKGDLVIISDISRDAGVITLTLFRPTDAKYVYYEGKSTDVVFLEPYAAVPGGKVAGFPEPRSVDLLKQAKVNDDFDEEEYMTEVYGPYVETALAHLAGRFNLARLKDDELRDLLAEELVEKFPEAFDADGIYDFISELPEAWLDDAMYYATQNPVYAMLQSKSFKRFLINKEVIKGLRTADSAKKLRYLSSRANRPGYKFLANATEEDLDVESPDITTKVVAMLYDLYNSGDINRETPAKDVATKLANVNPSSYGLSVEDFEAWMANINLLWLGRTLLAVSLGIERGEE